MNAYMDSSAILRLILGEPDGFTGWDRCSVRVASVLAEVECLRTLDRIRLTNRLSAKETVARREALFHILETMEVVDLTPPIIRRASDPFPVPLRTLDSIHLATALTWRDIEGKDLTMVTHDRALGAAARSFGLPVEGV